MIKNLSNVCKPQSLTIIKQKSYSYHKQVSSQQRQCIIRNWRIDILQQMRQQQYWQHHLQDAFLSKKQQQQKMRQLYEQNYQTQDQEEFWNRFSMQNRNDRVNCCCYQKQLVSDYDQNSGHYQVKQNKQQVKNDKQNQQQSYCNYLEEIQI